MKTRVSIVLALTWVLLGFHQPVAAYLDPGSGSMFLQLLLGGAAGAAVIVKLYWRRVLSLFGVRRPPDEEDAPR